MAAQSGTFLSDGVNERVVNSCGSEYKLNAVNNVVLLLAREKKMFKGQYCAKASQTALSSLPIVTKGK